jgi:hypothetical protein
VLTSVAKPFSSVGLNFVISPGMSTTEHPVWSRAIREGTHIRLKISKYVLSVHSISNMRVSLNLGAHTSKISCS